MDNDLAKHIGNEIKRVRETRRMTQGELATRLSTKQPAISRIESGRFIPSLNYLQKLLTVLDARIEIKVLESN
jgi:transcriptional regulator with XRE-family HTH domain